MKNKMTRLSRLPSPLLLAIILVAVWMCWSDRTPATAQTVPHRIAVVDAARALNMSNPGQSLNNQLKQMQDVEEQPVRRMEEEIRRLQAAMNSGKAPAGSMEQLAQKHAVLEKEQLQKQDEVERDMNNRRKKLLGGLGATMSADIAALAKEMKYTFVFDKKDSGLLYADDSTDITDAVIARLNSPAH
jgi:outer membrane protein